MMVLGASKFDLIGWLKSAGVCMSLLFLSSSFLLGKSELDLRLEKDIADKQDLIAGPLLDDLQYLRKLV